MQVKFYSYHMMDSDHKQDIKYIQEWMQKAAHLPEPFNDKLILRFLHSNYYSLEQTKICIERFCNSRHYMPDVYTKRDPLLPSMKTVNSLDVSAVYFSEEVNVLIFKLGDNIDKYILTDTYKGISQKIDVWLETDSRLSELDIFIYDLINVTIKHVPKTNPFVLREFVLYLLKANPVRLKKIFLINAPPITEIFYNMVKPILPAELIKNVVISSDDKPIRDFIDKKLLPLDYGGEALSVKETSDIMNELISSKYRDMFLDDNLWQGDVTKIPKKDIFLDMNGSFRTLEID